MPCKPSGRLWLAVAFVVNMFVLPHGHAWAEVAQLQTGKPLRIAVIKDYPLFTAVSFPGNLAGLFVEFRPLWSDHPKIPVEFALPDWPQPAGALQNEEAGSHPGSAWMLGVRSGRLSTLPTSTSPLFFPAGPRISRQHRVRIRIPLAARTGNN